MPATLNEHTQFVDDGGKPLVSGKVYFGVQNADPTISPVNIFSDRALSVAITNPQPLDANGRTTNKVWVAGRYSIRVDDVDDNQKYQNLDNGESADKGVTALENVTGANTIVADAASTITAYEDLEQYTFRTAQANTGPVTLNIDGLGAKSVVKNHDQPIQPGNFEADQNIIVTRNATDDVFEWTNQNLKSVASYKGTAIADSATPTVPTDGDYFESLGTTTRTSYVVAANRQWTEKSVSGYTLTAGAPIVTLDGNDLDLTAGQTVTLQSTASNVVQVISTSGSAITMGTAQDTTSGTSIDFPGILPGTTQININLAGVGTTGTSPKVLRIGDGGGIEPAGYTSAGSQIAGASPSSGTSTTGFVIFSAAAADTLSGNITLNLIDAATNTWSCSPTLKGAATTTILGGGDKSLSDVLTQLSLTTEGGSDTFDAGKMNISFQ